MDLAGEGGGEAGDWQSNLSSWKSRRKSHSSNPRLTETEEEQRQREEEETAATNRRKAKTFKEMLEEKERRLGNYGAYSYDDDIIGSVIERRKSESAQDTNYSSTTSGPSTSGDSQYEDNHLRQADDNSRTRRDELNNLSPPQLQPPLTTTTATTVSRPADHNSNVASPSKTNKPQAVDYSVKVIRISQRPNHTKGFGFTICGGRELNEPISIERIALGSSADVNELKSTDEILEINGADVSGESCATVRDMLDEAVKVGQLELKIKRLKESGMDDEDIFDDDDEFAIRNQQARITNRLSLDSQFSTPPPSPPKLSTSDYNEEPPPLPTLPPPPISWNSFPQELSPLPPNPSQNSLLTVKPERSDSRNLDPSETNRGELIRRRSEFLGIQPEQSEEYRQFMREKEEMRMEPVSAGVSAKRPPLTNEEHPMKTTTTKNQYDTMSQSTVSAGEKFTNVRDMFSKTDNTNSTSSMGDRNKVRLHDDHALDGVQSQGDGAGGFRAERDRLKHEAEERYRAEQEEQQRQQSRRAGQMRDKQNVQTKHIAEPRLMENSVKHQQQQDKSSNSSISIGSSSPRNTKGSSSPPNSGSVEDISGSGPRMRKSQEQPINAADRRQLDPVPWNVRGSESLPYGELVEKFQNLREAPHVEIQKTYVPYDTEEEEKEMRRNRMSRKLEIEGHDSGKVSTLPDQYIGISGRDGGAHQQQRFQDQGMASRYNVDGPQPYTKAVHSRSSSSELLKSTPMIGQTGPDLLAKTLTQPMQQMSVSSSDVSRSWSGSDMRDQRSDAEKKAASRTSFGMQQARQDVRSAAEQKSSSLTRNAMLAPSEPTVAHTSTRDRYPSSSGVAMPAPAVVRQPDNISIPGASSNISYLLYGDSSSDDVVSRSDKAGYGRTGLPQAVPTSDYRRSSQSSDFNKPPIVSNVNRASVSDINNRQPQGIGGESNQPLRTDAYNKRSSTSEMTSQHQNKMPVSSTAKWVPTNDPYHTDEAREQFVRGLVGADQPYSPTAQLAPFLDNDRYTAYYAPDGNNYQLVSEQVPDGQGFSTPQKPRSSVTGGEVDYQNVQQQLLRSGRLPSSSAIDPRLIPSHRKSNSADADQFLAKNEEFIPLASRGGTYGSSGANSFPRQSEVSTKSFPLSSMSSNHWLAEEAEKRPVAEQQSTPPRRQSTNRPGNMAGVYAQNTSRPVPVSYNNLPSDYPAINRSTSQTVLEQQQRLSAESSPRSPRESIQRSPRQFPYESIDSDKHFTGREPLHTAGVANNQLSPSNAYNNRRLSNEMTSQNQNKMPVSSTAKWVPTNDPYRTEDAREQFVRGLVGTGQPHSPTAQLAPFLDNDRYNAYYVPDSNDIRGAPAPAAAIYSNIRPATINQSFDSSSGNTRSHVALAETSQGGSSGAVDSLFSYVGSTGGNPGNSGSWSGTAAAVNRSNPGTQGSMSRGQGSLYLDGTPQYGTGIVASTVPIPGYTTSKQLPPQDRNLGSNTDASVNGSRRIVSARCSVCGGAVDGIAAAYVTLPPPGSELHCKSCFADYKAGLKYSQL